MSTTAAAQDRPAASAPMAALRRSALPLVVAVVAAAVGAWLATSSLPDQYTSEGIVVLEPANDRGSDASLIRLRAPTYVSYLLADATQDRLAAGLDDEGRAALDELDVELVSDTGTILVRVTSTSPETARDVVAVVMAEAEDFGSSELNLLLSVVAEPVLPTRPSGPPRTLLMATGVLVAVMLAIGAALVWDRLRPRLHAPERIRELVDAPTVTVVPRRRTVGIVPSDTDPQVLTAVRVLRTHLERDLHLPTSVAVVSPDRGEGRTTITALLGRSLANLDLRVLVVDADPERRRLSDLPIGGALPPGGGLSADNVVPTAVDGLSLLTLDADLAGDDVARRLPAVLGDVRDEVDVVLVDTPPLLGGDLARAVAVSTEHCLLVVPWGAPWERLERTAAALENLRVDVAGVVVNRGRGRGSR